MSELHNFDLGERVTVFNRFGAKFEIEGQATVIDLWPGEDQYLVRFDGHRGKQTRYVDPNGQEDPEAYVKKLNDYADVHGPEGLKQ